MVPKVVKQQIRERLKEGKSYAETHAELVAQYPVHPVELAQEISSLPLLKIRKRFLLANIVIAILLLGSAGAKVYFSTLFDDDFEIFKYLTLLFLAGVDLIIIVCISLWKTNFGNYALAVAVLGLLGCFKAVSYDVDTVQMAAWIGLQTSIGWLGYLLGKKVGGNFVAEEEAYRDAKGNLKSKSVVRWIE